MRDWFSMVLGVIAIALVLLPIVGGISYAIIDKYFKCKEQMYRNLVAALCLSAASASEAFRDAINKEGKA